MPSYKEAIVLGNGPSLKDSLDNNPAFFNDKELFCVNSFSITNSYQELKPSHYVMLDPNFWLFNGDRKNSPVIADSIDAIEKETTWPIILHLPQAARKSKILSALETKNSSIRIHYFNYTVLKGFRKFNHLLFDMHLGTPQCQNVIVASLFLAIQMKFENIYLFGADHNWHQNIHVDDQNIVCIKDVHFYENIEQVSYRKFYKSDAKKDTFLMHELFNAWAKVFGGYHVLKNYSFHRKVNILNCSQISFVDAFERTKL